MQSVRVGIPTRVGIPILILSDFVYDAARRIADRVLHLLATAAAAGAGRANTFGQHPARGNHQGQQAGNLSPNRGPAASSLREHRARRQWVFVLYSRRAANARNDARGARRAAVRAISATRIAAAAVVLSGRRRSRGIAAPDAVPHIAIATASAVAGLTAEQPAVAARRLNRLWASRVQ